MIVIPLDDFDLQQNKFGFSFGNMKKRTATNIAAVVSDTYLDNREDDSVDDDIRRLIASDYFKSLSQTF